MTTKDYKLVAEILNDWQQEVGIPIEQYSLLVRRFYLAFGSRDPRFDPSQFTEACYDC